MSRKERRGDKGSKEGPTLLFWGHIADFHIPSVPVLMKTRTLYDGGQRLVSGSFFAEKLRRNKLLLFL